MSARLTDRQRKRIAADRADGMTYREIAAKYGIGKTTARKIANSDPELAKKIAARQAENTADVMAYMDSKSYLVCEIIGKILDTLNDVDRMNKATVVQLATAYGILVDKSTVINSALPPVDDASDDDALSKSLQELADSLESDAVD